MCDVSHPCARYESTLQQRFTPLLAAVAAGRPDLVKLLIDAGVDVNLTGHDDQPETDFAQASPCRTPPLALNVVRDSPVSRASPLMLAIASGIEQVRYSSRVSRLRSAVVLAVGVARVTFASARYAWLATDRHALD